MRVDEMATSPDYQVGISPQELVQTVTGRGTILVTAKRPPGRVEVGDGSLAAQVILG